MNLTDFPSYEDEEEEEKTRDIYKFSYGTDDTIGYVVADTLTEALALATKRIKDISCREISGIVWFAEVLVP